MDQFNGQLRHFSPNQMWISWWQSVICGEPIICHFSLNTPLCWHTPPCFKEHNVSLSHLPHQWTCEHLKEERENETADTGGEKTWAPAPELKSTCSTQGTWSFQTRVSDLWSDFWTEHCTDLSHDDVRKELRLATKLLKFGVCSIVHLYCKLLYY